MAKLPSFVRWKLSPNPCEPDCQPCRNSCSSCTAQGDFQLPLPGQALGSSQTWMIRQEPSRFPESCLSSYLCFPCCLGSSMDLLPTHGGAQPAPVPHGGAQGCGVMEELSFLGALRNHLDYCRISRCLILHHLQDGASQPSCGSWCHRVLQESWNGLGWNRLGWKGPAMPLPRPGSLERAPTTRG